MESTSCDEEGSLRDNNVDLNEENIENHMSLEVSSQLVEADNLFASNQPNSENPEPFVGMEFESEEGAKLFYMAYASRIGFSVRISKSRRSRNDESIIMRRFVCSKEGFHLKKGNFDDGKKKRKRATIREGCNAMIEVIQKYYGRWVVTKLVKEHNHKSLLPPLSKPPIGESLGGFNNSPPYDHDFRNERREARYTAFGFDETQKLLGYFKRMNAENPTTFSYAFQVDKNNCLTHAFWADAKARASYYYFGDAVSFDTSFKENKDLLPFFMFTGLNHHLQSVIFGCALLTDEAEASFIWLFENWVAAMGARHPTSLVTEFNEAMGVAISKVFPETHHRFCKWHILNQCKEQLANIYGTSATFEEEFERCIVESESIELFESTWKSVIDKYDLGENSWLRFLYNMRQKWVPVFFKDMFTAEISATQKPESLKFFFEKYFNTTTPLPVFISLFEHAIAGWCEREALEDLATSFTRPVLKTPSNILKQVADVYTRAIFNIFQDEFIHSLGYYVEKIEDGLVSKFNVAKEEDIHRSCTVTYDFSDKRSKCSCSKFENCGILCRHILRVFLTVDVRALPEFYILKRWTKEAKNGFMLDECIRYNELYRDAVRYAKEGSTSADVFNFAQQTLQVAFADVVQMKQDIVNRCAM
uniref:Protein FAR1-RELATED SEQUENCE n=1 Tax=Ananas comosus var. bracteatus TaxID=296719 RepID=A0A6V7PPX2_ANACO|nr:unnamed protein product [Ananas comosus var. bracteatus]